VRRRCGVSLQHSFFTTRARAPPCACTATAPASETTTAPTTRTVLRPTSAPFCFPAALTELTALLNSYYSYGYYGYYDDGAYYYYYYYYYDDDDDAFSGADDDYSVDDDAVADFFDDLARFDPTLWFRECAGCAYGGAGLSVSGDSMLVRSASSFSDLTRVSAALTKR